MDEFSEGEIAVLENRGYLLAEAAIKRWLPDLATVDAALRIPHGDWMVKAWVREALRNSAKRTFFGRSTSRSGSS